VTDGKGFEPGTLTVGRRVHRLTAGGRLALARADYMAAVSAFERVFELSPDSFDLLIELGNAHYALGHLTRSEEVFRAAVRYLPADARVWASWGTLLSLTGRSGEACEAFEESCRLSPDSLHAAAGAGDCNRVVGRDAEALVWLERALVLNPRHASSLRAMADILTRRGEGEAATNLWVRALAEDPLNIFALEGLEQCWARP